jgi:hypothetical protein
MTHITAAALLAAALAVGCDNTADDKTPAPSTHPAPTTPPPTPTADAATPAAPAAPGAGTPTAAAPSADATAAAPAGATTAPAMTAAEAQTKLDQVTQYIKENKLELAETTLKQLENNKASLPVSVADKLPQARTLLNTAKTGGTVKDAASGLKLPG